MPPDAVRPPTAALSSDGAPQCRPTLKAGRQGGREARRDPATAAQLPTSSSRTRLYATRSTTGVRVAPFPRSSLRTPPLAPSVTRFARDRPPVSNAQWLVSPDKRI
ncbi:hypothetical protein GCM10010170_006710 [Dactylosporangium salmoneum]|uniref:Uncharacterized protein n=1 Tax=Dactylosporangium salmoneum TaxID=53361 RepID=A0ABP5SEE2_9ACTN